MSNATSLIPVNPNVTVTEDAKPGHYTAHIAAGAVANSSAIFASFIQSKKDRPDFNLTIDCAKQGALSTADVGALIYIKGALGKKIALTNVGEDTYKSLERLDTRRYFVIKKPVQEPVRML